MVLALGQDVDLSLLDGVPGLEIEDGVVKVDADMMTGHPGIFAGGDMVPGERTVTVGIGHGKLAARNIDAWLRGKTWTHPPSHELATLRQAQHLVLLGRAEVAAAGARHDPPAVDVRGGRRRLRRATAQFEARRCLSCGNCFECDNCYGVCPDNAVIKLGPGQRYEFNYDYCKGCGLCVTRVPLRRDPHRAGGDLGILGSGAPADILLSRGRKR